MSRVVHFEIAANDPEKVTAFYQNVFGWKIAKWGGPQDYWVVTTSDPASPGIDGGIFRPNEWLMAPSAISEDLGGGRESERTAARSWSKECYRVGCGLL
jgi:catechol 2,3-dioxygenase-like lactoylglutathione lyase family enzyme